MFDQIIQDANEIAEKYIANCTDVTAEQLGLDERCGYSFYACDDFLAVRDCHERSLRYYGGFEYVGQDYRMQLGEWVFYSTENSRVQRHVSNALYDIDADGEE